MEIGSPLCPNTRYRFGLAGYNQRLLPRGSLDLVQRSVLADAVEKERLAGFSSVHEGLGSTKEGDWAVPLLVMDDELPKEVDYSHASIQAGEDLDLM